MLEPASLTAWHPCRRVVAWLSQAALSAPTGLVGLLLYPMLSRQGPMGPMQSLFTQGGMIAGQALIAMPVLISFTLAAVQAADSRLIGTAHEEVLHLIPQLL